MSQKCDHFHVFVGVILRYPGGNAVLSDKGRTELKKQKRFQCHAKLFEKPAVLAAPCVVANYLGNGDFFMINDNCSRLLWYYRFLAQRKLNVLEATPADLTEFVIWLCN